MTRPGTMIAVPLMILALSWFGCGDAAEDDEEDRSVSGTYEVDGDLVVDVVFEPDPPRTGAVDMEMELFVDDEAAEGAAIEVEPWMPAHAHGSSTEAVVHDEGQGHYRVDDLTFSMPGLWEVHIDVEYDERSWEFVIPVEVEG